MTKQRPTLDGFIPRRAINQLGDRRSQHLHRVDGSTGLRPMRQQEQAEKPGRQGGGFSISRDDLDRSLKNIDLGDNAKGRRKDHKKRGAKKVRPVVLLSDSLYLLS